MTPDFQAAVTQSSKEMTAVCLYISLFLSSALVLFPFFPLCLIAPGWPGDVYVVCAGPELAAIFSVSASCWDCRLVLHSMAVHWNLASWGIQEKKRWSCGDLVTQRFVRSHHCLRFLKTEPVYHRGKNELLRTEVRILRWQGLTGNPGRLILYLQIRWCGTLTNIPHCSLDSTGAHYGKPAYLHALPDDVEHGNKPQQFLIVSNIIKSTPEERGKGWEELGK